MMARMSYPIGTPGVPWGPAEKAAWLARQGRRRSYEADVVGVMALSKDAVPAST